jgi:GNAT superfamily N-acetyltransferase
LADKTFSKPHAVMQTGIRIIDYKPELASCFSDLNIAWLEQYFYVEPIDRTMLAQPDTYILKKGGYIFFAEQEGTVVGTFAFLKVDDGVFELSKMAVVEALRGQKIGTALLQFAIDKATELGIKKLVLFSNKKLKPAIHLYRKFGFQEVGLGKTEYKRSDIKMEKSLS